jgi:hypothetical protein
MLESWTVTIQSQKILVSYWFGMGFPVRSEERLLGDCWEGSVSHSPKGGT